MPWPTDAEFADPKSPYYYPSFSAAREGFRRDHVPAVGPTIYVTTGLRVHIEFVVASRYVDMIYFAAGAERVYSPIAGHEVIDGPEGVDRLAGARLRAVDVELSAYHPLGTRTYDRGRRPG